MSALSSGHALEHATHHANLDKAAHAAAEEAVKDALSEEESLDLVTVLCEHACTQCSLLSTRFAILAEAEHTSDNEAG